MKHAWPLLLTALATGCVFRASDGPRYYRPESSALTAAAEGAVHPTSAAIRLRPVLARPFLRERIVWRTPTEYGMYEQRRWSELPSAYAERALVATLLRTSGTRVTDDTRAPALSVVVTAFEEVLAPAHVANVAMVVSLGDPSGRSLFARSFSSEVAISGGGTGELVHAVGQALDDVSGHVAEAVDAALLHPAASRPAAQPSRGARRRPHRQGAL